jgi:hypothetical protein
VALAGARGACVLAAAILVTLSAARFVWEVKRSQDICCADFPLYWAQLHETQATGRLYPGADDLNNFLPGAPVYKFPPFYAALLLPALHAGVGDGVYALHAVVQVLLLFASVLLVCSAWPARPAAAVVAALVLALNHGPFFETLWRLQAEGWIVALVAGALALTARGRDFGAGVLIGLAAMLKLYPALLAVYFVAARRPVGLAGVLVGAALGAAVGVLAFGVGESAVYFGRLVPFMADEIAVDGFATEGMGLPRYVEALLAADPRVAKRIASGVVLAALVATSLVTWRRAGRDGGVAWSALAFASFLPLSIQLMPNSWANYQLLLLPALLAILGAGGFRGRAAVAPLCLAGAAAVLMAYHQQTHDFATWLGPHGTFFASWQTLRGACPWLVWAAGLWLLVSAEPRRAAAPPPGSAPSPAASAP